MRGKKEILIVIFVFISIVISMQTYAFGFSPSYLENNTLYINQGKRADYSIVIQNSEDQDVIVMVELLGDYAKIKGILENTTNVSVRAKSMDTQITFEINPPPNARIGQNYQIWYRLTPMIKKDGGTMPFTMRLNKQFNVFIVKDGGKGTEPTTASPVHFEIRKFMNKITAGIKETTSKYNVAITYAMYAIIALAAILIFAVLWRKSRFMAQRIGSALQAFGENQGKGYYDYHRTENRNKDKLRMPPVNARKALKLRNKKKIKNLKEMYDAIYVMDEKTFNHHVNKYRNDFSLWIEEELNDERLARALSRSLTKDWFIRVLSGEVAHIETKKRKKR